MVHGLGISVWVNAGLDADAQYPAKILSVLKSDLSNTSSYANSLIDPRYKAMATELNVQAGGDLTTLQSDPLIADVALQAGGNVVVTGKGYGSTNLIVLDRAGATVMTKTIQVVGPRDAVVVYRGIDRYAGP